MNTKNNKTTLSRLAAVLLLAVMTSATAWATDVVLSGSDSYTAQDGDVLSGSTSGTVTIADDAKITLNGVTINGGIVCAGDAEITLVGTNSVTGANQKAGIQVGSSGTTLTIKGDGSLTAQGGLYGAGIGSGVTYGKDKYSYCGNIVIEGGTITAQGGYDGAGIGTGQTYYYGIATLGNITINGGSVTATGGYNGAGIGTGESRDSKSSVSLGSITINGGTVTATGGHNGAGIGTGYTYYHGPSVSLGNITINGGTVTTTGGDDGAGIGTGDTSNAIVSLGNITIYDATDLVDASSINQTITYMHGDTDVTANATDYFIILTKDDRNIIAKKDDTDYTITIASGIEHGTVTGAETGKYFEKITMTATPEAHYSFAKLIVKDSQDNDVPTEGTSFYMPKGNVTVSAEFQYGIWLSGSNNYIVQDGDELFGSTSGTVTIADGAKITLNDVTINGGIVCEGTAEITLIGTNSVRGANQKAGIQVGGEGTTLTIKGDGLLTATGGNGAAGIGLSYAENDATGGDIVIKSGTVTATGFNGIGTGNTGNNASVSIGTLTIYDAIDKVDASGINQNITYMHDDTDVTANATDYFNITMESIRCLIVQKDDTDYTITIDNVIEHGTLTGAETGKYVEKITMTAMPDAYYFLSRLIVKDGQDNDVPTEGSSFYMPKDNVTVSAEFMKGNIQLSGKNNYTVHDGDVLTGSTSGTVTIDDGAKIALYDATIGSGIVCAGTAEITLVGTNSVTGANQKAGIQVGGEGTTLTIKGDGALTATGGNGAAGIGLNYVENDATGGDIVIKSGTVTATGFNGIGTGNTGNNASVSIGTLTIYDAIGLVDASGINQDITYMHDDTDVTANATDYFIILMKDGRNIIAKKDDTDYTITIDSSIENGTVTGAETGKYFEKITMTATPDAYCFFVRLIVKDSQNNDVDVDGTSFYMPKDNVTVSAEFLKGNVLLSDNNNYTVQDGDILSGSTSGTVTIAEGAKITLYDATIGSGIVCEGTAEITLAGTNSVTGPGGKAGIQVGGTGTTLIIKGDGALTVTGGEGSAGIGLSSTSSDCTGGDIVIEGGTITAQGSTNAAGIGTGLAFNANVALGNITFKDGTVTATGGASGDGIGTGYAFGGNSSIGTVTVYVGVDRLDASSIKNFENVVYMYDEDIVTENASDFFDITVDGSHCVIVTDNAVTLTDGTAYNWISQVTSATYKKTLGSDRVGKHQAWFVPFDYTITSDDEEAFTFYKINMIANSPDPSQEATDDIWVFLKKLNAGDVLHGNMPYVYKPKQAVTDYNFTTLNVTLMEKADDARITMMTAEDTYTVYGTYENTTATAKDPFYYVNINGGISLGNNGTLTVGPYRWIIRKTSKFGNETSYAREMHFFDGEEEGVTTEIGTITNNREPITVGAWYTLDGRRLDAKPTVRGLYIHNGKKVVIK